MSRSALLWVFLLIQCEFCSAQAHPVKIAPSGTTTISISYGTKKIEAEFRTATVPISPSERSERRFAQCTYSRFPCSLTEKVSIRIGGNDVFIPRSAYADLGDILTAQLSADAKSVTLTITGGDASESYVAMLIFNQERLVQRKLYSGEDPDHPLEISQYYEVSMD